MGSLRGYARLRSRSGSALGSGPGALRRTLDSRILRSSRYALGSPAIPGS